MATSKISQIDQLIMNFEEKKPPIFYKTNFFELSKQILLYENIEYCDIKPEEKIFNKEIPKSAQTLVSICMLRIFNINPDFIRADRGFSYRVIGLFDRTLHQIYNHLKISEKTENYEKQNSLIDFVKHRELAIDKEIGISTDFKDIKRFCNVYRQTVNQPINKLIILPFFGDLLKNENLINIFRRINEFVDSDEVERVNQFKELDSLLESFILKVKEINTHYSRKFIEVPFIRIQNIIQDYFSKSPQAKPAKIIVEKNEKKYPLSVKGSIFEFYVNIKNIGKGNAYETKLIISNHNDELEIEDKELYIGDLHSNILSRSFRSRVLKKEETGIIEIQAIWQNFDGSVDKDIFTIEIFSQNTDIDWEKIKFDEPYSLEAVDQENELFGREVVLNCIFR